MENENFNSSIIKLKTLESEFGLLMNQYQQAQLNYLASINNGNGNGNGNTNSGNPKYNSLQGRTFWGTGGLQEGPAQSEDECKAMCSANSMCSGATYNSAKQYCWTRSGQGDIAVGLNTDTALITEINENAQTIQRLNQQLLDIINQINNETVNSVPQAQTEIALKNEQKQQLQKVYAKLQQERMQIENVLKEYEMLDQKYVDNSIYVEQTNTQYMLWLIFAVIIILVTIKNIFFPDMNSNLARIFFWVTLMILFVITVFHLNTAPGFLLAGTILLFIILIQLGIVPSPK